MQRIKWGWIWGMFIALLLLALIAAPSLYETIATRKLTQQLDELFGEQGWVCISVHADNQDGERINLYRTLFVQLDMPSLQKLTPYHSTTFTGGSVYGYFTMPPHYAVDVVTDDGRFIAYRWSMKEHAWYRAYGGYWGHLYIDGAKINWDNIRREDGLNFPGDRKLETVAQAE